MKAFGTNLIVKPIYYNKTKGGIEIPMSDYDRPNAIIEAEIISVGDGHNMQNKVDMRVKEGEKIFYKASSGFTFKKEEEEFRVLSITDILAKV
jgi:co-chaperonin GroES (HSP10)